MVMREQEKYFYKFGPFRLHIAERLLLRERKLVPLSPKAFDTLLVLVENSGHLVEKDELIEKVWPNSFVEEANLANNVSILRKALGEGTGGHQYIQTVPKRGYRFVATVKKLRDTGSDVEGQPTESSESQVYLKLKGSIPHDKTEAGRQFEQKPIWAEGGVNKASQLNSESLLSVVRNPSSHPLILNKPEETEAEPGLKAIAVLPFKSIGAEVGDNQLGLGMADALITRLSNIKQIIVRPTSTVLKYHNQWQDPVAAGRELRVESVLDGHVQRSGERIRVTVQLVSVRDGAPLWAEKFEEQFTDIFSVQDRLSEQVSKALMLKLSCEEKRLLTKRHTENPEAYQAYLKGRYFWNKRTEEALKKSLEYFGRAIEIDPNYALAYNGLTDSYVLLCYYDYLSPGEAVPKAKAAAMKGLEIDDTLAEGHTSLAYLKWYYDWDWSGAEAELKRAIELNPNYATAHQLYSYYLNAVGRFDEALHEMKQAHQLDPVSIIINAGLGLPFLFGRQYGQAIELFQKAIDMEPNFWLAHCFLGEAYNLKGEHHLAIAELQKAKRLGNSAWVFAKLGHAYAMSGKCAEARKLIDELTERSKHVYTSPYFRAVIHSSLNESDQAFEWLERAYEEQSCWMVYLKIEPGFDNIRQDWRFTQMLERVGFAIYRGAHN